MKMNSYKYIGVLTVFLLLMLQNMMAQTPDFSKMTHAQQVEYIKQQKLQAEVLKQKLIKQFNTPPQGTEKKKTGSVFVTFKRTILHSYNETKTSSDGAVNTQSGNSKVNINVNVSTEKVVVSDNGNSFSVTAYGDQHPERPRGREPVRSRHSPRREPPRAGTHCRSVRGNGSSMARARRDPGQRLPVARALPEV